MVMGAAVAGPEHRLTGQLERIAPAFALGLIHGVPELDGRALQNPVAWTVLRLVLTGLALILPWCLYVWLMGRRP